MKQTMLPFLHVNWKGYCVLSNINTNRYGISVQRIGITLADTPALLLYVRRQEYRKVNATSIKTIMLFKDKAITVGG